MFYMILRCTVQRFGRC